MDLVDLGGEGGVRLLLDGHRDHPPASPAAGTSMPAEASSTIKVRKFALRRSRAAKKQQMLAARPHTTPGLTGAVWFPEWKTAA